MNSLASTLTHAHTLVFTAGPGDAANLEFMASTTPLEPLDLQSTQPPPDDAQPAEAVANAPADTSEDLADVHSLEPVVLKEEGEVLLEPINGQIELLEHTPDSVGAVDTAVLGADDGHEWVDADNELKRVKVYELVGSRWQDQGTAFCFGQFSEETSEALLIARSERNYHDIILSTAIRSNDVYQRQQETLIVWTEPEGIDYALSFQDPEGCAEVWNFILEVQRHMNNSDDPAAASSPLLGPETSVTTASIIRSGHLPAPQLGIISEIERAIKTLARTQQVKERICEYIQSEDYIKSLVEVMHMAEDLESLENLHALCSLMQTILMLNDPSMYEHILDDDIFFGVVGMLEYDPDFPGHKANYREFLHNTSQYHQPVPIRDPGIQRKIHHTYRLQFLKDVVLARALDDSTHNVLNSCIIFNQMDIATHLQGDPSFLREIVRLFVDEEMLAGGGAGARRLPPPSQPMVISLNPSGDNVTKDANAMDVDPKPETSNSNPRPVNGSTVNGREGQLVKLRSASYAFAPPDNLLEEDVNLRKEVVLLLQQLCIIGKNIQIQARLTLFRSLVDRGILFAVQWALNLPERDESNKPVMCAAGEVLTALLDHDLNGVRGHVLKQVVAIEKEREAKKKGADKAETILEMCCRIMSQTHDLAVQAQVGDALKTWLDLPQLLGPDAGLGQPSEANPPKPALMGRKDEPGTERFMDYFYKDCAAILTKPFSDLPEWKNVTTPILPLTREEANRYVYLCELVHNFLSQHHFRSHFFVVSSNILPRVASLLRAKDKHLRHAAFRIFRLLLRQNNPNSHTHLMKHDIMKPILDLTLQEACRDNLLSCSCQEYFDHMRKENMKDLIAFCMEKHETEVRALSKTPLGGERFTQFIARYEMNTEPLPAADANPEKSPDPRGWPSGARGIDHAEENYFNADDDDDETPAAGSSPGTNVTWDGRTQTTISPSSPLLANNTGTSKRRGGSAGRPSLIPRRRFSALVDYNDEDDEEPTSETAPPPSEGGSKSPSPASSPVTRSQSLPPNASPSSAVAGPSKPPPKRPAREDEDAVENALESLLVKGKSRSVSPAPSVHKRRRDDDDDDFVRITKPKKTEVATDRTGGGASGTTPTRDVKAAPFSWSLRSGRQEAGAEPGSSSSSTGSTSVGATPPAKKIKVKLGEIGKAVTAALSGGQKASPPVSTSASRSPSPAASHIPKPVPSSESKAVAGSEASSKDGDTG